LGVLLLALAAAAIDNLSRPPAPAVHGRPPPTTLSTRLSYQ